MRILAITIFMLLLVSSIGFADTNIFVTMQKLRPPSGQLNLQGNIAVSGFSPPMGTLNLQGSLDNNFNPKFGGSLGNGLMVDIDSRIQGPPMQRGMIPGISMDLNFRPNFGSSSWSFSGNIPLKQLPNQYVCCSDPIMIADLGSVRC